MKLHLKKPIVFFDLEGTGVNVASDRIVEYCFTKLKPNGEQEILQGRLNPGIPIPLEASLIHGIYDKDVQEEPIFKEVAQKINAFLENADLGGYNSNKYDIPILAEEMLRAGIDFDISKRKLVDVQVIFHKMEQRTLSAAYKFYCQKELVPHQAEADITATIEVLEKQLELYADKIENNIDFLSTFTSTNHTIDFAGRFIYDEKGNEIINFGKHKGKTVAEILEKEPSYYTWIMNGDFPLYTKKALKEIKEKIQIRKLADKFKPSV